MIKKIEKISKCLETLQKDSLGLYYIQRRVDELNMVTSFQKYATNKRPCVLRSHINHWPAILKWNLDYLKDTIGSKNITASITPNGYTNGTFTHNRQSYFIMAEEKIMTVKEFVEHLQNPKPCMVFFAKRENFDRAVDYSEISDDVRDDFDWLTRTMNKKPDFIQLLIEDARCVTGIQKTPYENFYCILHGSKEFVMIPPADISYIPYDTYQIASYVNVNENYFDIEVAQGQIKWIAIDPCNPDIHKYPDFVNVNLFKVKLKAGDCLYLPSQWFYYAMQSHGCMCLNYCYDLNVAIKYVYNNLLKGL